MDYPSPITILLIEKNDAFAFEIEKMLLTHNHFIEKVVLAKTLQEAKELLSNTTFHLILSNLFLEDSRGLETFQQLRDSVHYVPMIIISSTSDDTLALEAIRLGAQDFISRNEVSTLKLTRMIRYALERQHLQDSLRTLSFTDELTGLYNRRGFLVLAEQQIHYASRHDQGFFLFFIDLDHLKEINDTFGHHEGDLALIEAANCLKNAFRHSDIIARIGGDEFAVLALNVSQDRGNILRGHIQEALQETNAYKNHPYKISFSVGMSYSSNGGDLTIESLLREADADLYSMKRSR